MGSGNALFPPLQSVINACIICVHLPGPVPRIETSVRHGPAHRGLLVVGPGGVVSDQNQGAASGVGTQGQPSVLPGGDWVGFVQGRPGTWHRQGARLQDRDLGQCLPSGPNSFTWLVKLYPRPGVLYGPPPLHSCLGRALVSAFFTLRYHDLRIYPPCGTPAVEAG